MNAEYADATEAGNPSQRIYGEKRDSVLNINTLKITTWEYWASEKCNAHSELFQNVITCCKHTQKNSN